MSKLSFLNKVVQGDALIDKLHKELIRVSNARRKERTILICIILALLAVSLLLAVK